MLRRVGVAEWCLTFAASSAALACVGLSASHVDVGGPAGPVVQNASKHRLETVLSADTLPPSLRPVAIGLEQAALVHPRSIGPATAFAVDHGLLQPSLYEVQWASLRAADPAPSTIAVPTKVPDPRKVLYAEFLGTWYPAREACDAQSDTDILPMVLSRTHATAGHASCRFLSTKPGRRGASIVARCSDGDEQWTANVSLALARDELTWSSERGAQSYIRCGATKAAKRVPKAKVAARKSLSRATKVISRPTQPTVRVIRGSAVPVSWVFVRTR
jgi:hypothetical protein